MYRIFINKDDKRKAIDIICDGISEYTNNGIDAYLDDYECTRDSEIIDTTEFYADDKKMAFITEICNEDELLKLQIDGRSKQEKIAIYWDKEYFTSDDILSDI